MSLVRSLALGTVLAMFGLGFAPACSSNNSKGGPPETPCGQTPTAHAPICGRACEAKCGCTTCKDGDTLTTNGNGYVCTGGCFLLTSVGDSGTGGSVGTGGAGGSDSGPDCSNVDCQQDPPLCGNCTTCACCTCNAGDTVVVQQKIYACTGSCFQPLFDAGSDGG